MICTKPWGIFIVNLYDPKQKSQRCFLPPQKRWLAIPWLDLILPDLRRALQGVTDGHAEIDVLHLSWKEKNKGPQEEDHGISIPTMGLVYFYLHEWLIFYGKMWEIHGNIPVPWIVWRIMPVSKWLVTFIYKPWKGHLEGEQPYLGEDHWFCPQGPWEDTPNFPFQPHSSKEIPKHRLLVKHPRAHLPGGPCGWDLRQEEHHGIAYHHQAVKGLLKLISLPQLWIWSVLWL